MQVNHTYTSVHGQDSESLIIKRDIYNERANVRRDEFGGLFPIYALFRFVLWWGWMHRLRVRLSCEKGMRSESLKQPNQTRLSQ
jgi:hypothetical protein